MSTSPPSRKLGSTLPRLSPRFLRGSLLALFLSGGSIVLVALILPWLPWGRWHGELFAVGALVALLSPVLGVVLEASLEEAEEGESSRY